MVDVANDKKQDIHRMACRLFREQGYPGTTVRQIAQKVGLMGGSLYAHVKSKDDLLWEIVNEAADRFLTTLRGVRDSPLGIMQKLRSAITAHVDVITSDLDAAAVYTFEWRHLPAKRKKAFTARRDEYEHLFRELVDQAVHDRFITAKSAASATLFILSALNWVSTWYRPDGEMSPDDVGRMLADYIFDGLRRRTA
jgi:AcrR family transcriptional regulator